MKAPENSGRGEAKASLSVYLWVEKWQQHYGPARLQACPLLPALLGSLQEHCLQFKILHPALLSPENQHN